MAGRRFLRENPLGGFLGRSPKRGAQLPKGGVFCPRRAATSTERKRAHNVLITRTASQASIFRQYPMRPRRGGGAERGGVSPDATQAAVERKRAYNVLITRTASQASIFRQYPTQAAVERKRAYNVLITRTASQASIFRQYPSDRARAAARSEEASAPMRRKPPSSESERTMP